MALAYAPSLETTPVRIAPRYDHFIGGQVACRRRAARRSRPSTRRPARRARTGRGRHCRRRRRAPSRPAAAPTKASGSRCGRPTARSTCTASRARSPSARASWPSSRSMDGGKPIKESRDFDVVQAAAHFFYYAGWADKLRYAVPGTPTPTPLGVVGSIVPWNFPLLMAAWKIAPAIAAGNTIVLKPAETTPLTALLLARDLRRGRSAARRRQHRHRRRRDRRRAWSRIRTSTRSRSPARPKSARSSSARSPGRRKPLTLELGGKAANIVFADAPLDQAVEGVVNGIYFNQGHVCCAGSRLLVQEPIHDEVVEKLDGAHRDAAPGRPARQEHRHRRDQLRRAARQDRRARRAAASPKARCCTSSRARCPTRGWFFPRLVLHRRRRRRTASRAKRSSGRCSRS